MHFKIIKIDESKEAQSVYIKNYSGIYTTVNHEMLIRNRSFLSYEYLQKFKIDIF